MWSVALAVIVVCSQPAGSGKVVQAAHTHSHSHGHGCKCYASAGCVGVCPYHKEGLCCEAARYHSRVPKGHCKAIARGLRQVFDNSADMFVGAHEWGKKIRNTLLLRGQVPPAECVDDPPVCVAVEEAPAHIRH